MTPMIMKTCTAYDMFVDSLSTIERVNRVTVFVFMFLVWFAVCVYRY